MRNYRVKMYRVTQVYAEVDLELSKLPGESTSKFRERLEDVAIKMADDKDLWQEPFHEYDVETEQIRTSSETK